MKRILTLLLCFLILIHQVHPIDAYEDEVPVKKKKKRILQDIPAVDGFDPTDPNLDPNEPLVSIEDYCDCEQNYEPVCGSNGQTYNNKCIFDCENRKMLMANHPGISVVKAYPCEEEAEL
ncbi:uncharacterized protein LOC109546952 [Dendroctonus ponderosae]|uniref:Kazal-like domain-containing protein n=1 Tax=Dendroctonus ponderosae TaxID=77166 RepID=A0AAR5QKH0_DENPD|nr:uncharacterized protein LOC109546952 [Dendroctonus ponderosae]KAH1004995.1 hypothetical protein HUJ04_006076 [Dendroctonus ponderosae]KAH1012105.1 hypothetical protein HUJ05_011322 [Dendroctonus ponderosae]